MAQLGRKGRILKWAGLALSLLIVLAWAASMLWWVGHYRDVNAWRVGAELVKGHLTLECSGPEQPQEPFWGSFPLSPYSDRYRMFWRPYANRYLLGTSTVVRSLVLPLYIPFLIFAIPTGYLWWRDRRRIPPGHCQKCGYNLTGNVSGVCPECGEKT